MRIVVQGTFVKHELFRYRCKVSGYSSALFTIVNALLLIMFAFIVLFDPMYLLLIIYI